MKRMSLVIVSLLMMLCTSAADYKGQMIVGEGKYRMDEVRVSLSSEGTLTLYDVKFSRFMPVRVDVVIPDVRLTSASAGVELGGDGMIPTVNGKPHPSRIATQMKGLATKQTLRFNVLFGGKHLSFSGKAF